MALFKFSGANLPSVVSASASFVQKTRGRGSTRNAWIALPALAIVMMLPIPSMATTLLQDGSSLVFTGDATVSAISLSWSCNQPGDSPCAAGTGDFSVGSSTDTFATYNGTFGRIMNITEAGQPIQNTPFATLADFITFLKNTNITLDLTEIPEGTDPTSATCTGSNHCTPTNAAYANANNPGGSLRSIWITTRPPTLPPPPSLFWGLCMTTWVGIAPTPRASSAASRNLLSA